MPAAALDRHHHEQDEDEEEEGEDESEGPANLAGPEPHVLVPGDLLAAQHWENIWRINPTNPPSYRQDN